MLLYNAVLSITQFFEPLDFLPYFQKSLRYVSPMKSVNVNNEVELVMMIMSDDVQRSCR